MKSGFAAQYADPLPGDLIVDTLGDEGLDGRDGYFYLAGSLRAGAVAVDTLQIATVSDVYFDEVSAGLERLAESFGNKRLGTYKLICIQYQSSHGYIAMALRCY